MPFGFGRLKKALEEGADQVQTDKILQPNRARGATSNKKAHEDTQDDNKAGGPGTIIVGAGAPPIGRVAKPGFNLEKANKKGKWEKLDLEANRGGKPGVSIEKVNKEGKWEKLDCDPRKGGAGGVEVEKN